MVLGVNLLLSSSSFFITTSYSGKYNANSLLNLALPSLLNFLFSSFVPGVSPPAGVTGTPSLSSSCLMPFATLFWLTVFAFSSDGPGVGFALADLDLRLVYVFAGLFAGVFGAGVFGAGAPPSALRAGASNTGLASTFIRLFGSPGSVASVSRLDLFLAGVCRRFSGSREASAVFNASVSLVVVVLERRDLAGWEAIVRTFVHSSTSINGRKVVYRLGENVRGQLSRICRVVVVGRDEMSRGRECDNEQFPAGDEKSRNKESIAVHAESQ